MMDGGKTREMPGWEDAPIPVCFGGDAPALTFCCREVHAMPPGFECTRDEKLAEVGLSPQEFVELKELFSRNNTPTWEADETCHGSLAYCCMRSGGCPPRDSALRKKYPGREWEEILTEYFQSKKKLSSLIVSAAEQKKREQGRET